MKKLPPLNAVRAFEAAARLSSFTAAGAALHVTPGAVSRSVQLLERWLGGPLFHRSSSKLSLTDAGIRYLAEIVPALERIAEASERMIESRDTTVLHIDAPPTFSMRWLIPRLSTFKRRHDGVEIKFSASTDPVDFRRNSYGIAIRSTPQPASGCRSVPFMTLSFVPICHASLVRGSRPFRVEDLASHTLITYQREPCQWTDWLAQAGAPGLRPAGYIDFENMSIAMQAAVEGLGVVLVPMPLVADDIISGRLCAPMGQLASCKRVYYAHHPAGGNDDALIADFCDWLVREGHDTEESIRLFNDYAQPSVFLRA